MIANPPTPPHHMSTLSYASEFCRVLPNQFEIYINSKCSQGHGRPQGGASVGHRPPLENLKKKWRKKRKKKERKKRTKKKLKKSLKEKNVQTKF